MRARGAGIASRARGHAPAGADRHADGGVPAAARLAVPAGRVHRVLARESPQELGAPAGEKRTGQQKVLATYQCHEGERQLVGQRVNGTVHISDIPTGEQGRVYLVEQNLTTIGELQAIVDDYTAKAAELGHPPMQAWF